MTNSLRPYLKPHISLSKLLACIPTTLVFRSLDIYNPQIAIIAKICWGFCMSWALWRALAHRFPFTWNWKTSHCESIWISIFSTSAFSLLSAVGELTQQCKLFSHVTLLEKSNSSMATVSNIFFFHSILPLILRKAHWIPFDFRSNRSCQIGPPSTFHHKCLQKC